MNFLAHAYLSGSDKDITIGNFIADSIRGKEFELFRDGIQKGIQLHRKIDFFTDRHPIVIETNFKLKPYFGKYSSVVSDIYYDHFLSLHWNQYSAIPLSEYSEYIYSIISDEIHFMPSEVKMFFPYMKKNNWLYNYQTFYGLERAFYGMSKRASFESNMENAVIVLKEKYSEFENEFFSYFPLLEDFVNEDLK